MNKILWLIGGTTLAVAVFAVLNAPETAAAGGVDRAAGKLGDWGLKQRASGAGGNLLGKVEEFAGKATGDGETRTQGALDQAAGAVRNAAGQAAESLGNTIHELKK